MSEPPLNVRNPMAEEDGPSLPTEQSHPPSIRTLASTMNETASSTNQEDTTVHNESAQPGHLDTETSTEGSRSEDTPDGLRSSRSVDLQYLQDWPELFSQPPSSITTLYLPDEQPQSQEGTSDATAVAGDVQRTNSNSRLLKRAKDGEDPRSRRDAWLPHTLKPQFLCLLGLSTTVLLITVTTMYWYSATHDGLGSDNGSSIILLGWRFTPSVFAVLYVQLTAMLLDDVKRTEPFARMAKAGGAAAANTVLQAPGAWWNALFDGFSKKTDGRRSKVLIAAALMNIIGFLAISPLSASLLESKDIAIQKETGFSRMVPRSDGPLSLKMGRETYLRIIGNLLQGVSTSAWISDDHTMFPFWPSSLESAPLGPLLSSSTQTWQAESSVLSTSMDCNPMSVVIKNTSYEMVWPNEEPRVTLELASNDGCKRALELNAKNMIFGGVVWSQIGPIRTYDLDGVSRALDSPYWFLSRSDECDQKELLLISTPLFETDSIGQLTSNLSFLPDYNISVQLCSTHNYVGNLNIKASLSESDSAISFDQQEYLRQRALIPGEMLNFEELQNTTLSWNWPDYLSVPEHQTRPSAADLSTVLAAQYNFNMTAMLEDGNIVARATTAKQRILGEVLQHSLMQPNSSETHNMRGTVTVLQRRVTVIAGVAITLTTLLFISFCLLLLLWRYAGKTHRHLNLKNDPATTISTADLLATDVKDELDFRQLHQYSRSGMHQSLQQNEYFTTFHTLHTRHGEEKSNTDKETRSDSIKVDRIPAVLRLRVLLALEMFLILLFIAILVLYSFARKSRLYNAAFTYQAKLALFSSHVSTIAPFSILPTLFAVCVGLWWSSMDATFRRLQPFISMAGGPTSLASGANLSYQSSYWIIAATKAASRRHWLLFIVTLGTTLTPIFTISMSALFERSTAVLTHSTQIQRNLEIRAIPFVSETDRELSPHEDNPETGEFISQLFTHMSTNWMYGATIQLAFNGTEPPWSRDGWNFVPLDLSNITDHTRISHSDSQSLSTALNVSVTTPAVRGRIDCTPYRDLSNISTWLVLQNLSDSSTWNVSHNPQGAEIGYAFGAKYANDGESEFVDTPVEGHVAKVQCCLNGSDALGQGSAIGYWSHNSAKDLQIQGPLDFTTKWIHGNGIMGSFDEYMNGLSETHDRFLFTDIPEAAALHCIPVIETAEANVVVDRDTRRVQSFSIIGNPVNTAVPWEDNFQPHYKGVVGDRINITASYGILFEQSLFSSSHITRLSPTNWDTPVQDEDLSDKAFNFRDPTQGLNLDFMTYAMYCLAGKDPKALLNSTLMDELAKRTFTAFFQHYVSDAVSMETGGWAYQTINASLPDIGVYTDRDRPLPRPLSTTNRTAVVAVAQQTEVLDMNPAAVWLSISILVWLMATTVVIAALQRRYLRNLDRNIECIGDVLVLVAGSDKLLQLVRERGAEGFKGEKGVKTKLGWFEDSGGQQRWGIEIVEQEDSQARA